MKTIEFIKYEPPKMEVIEVEVEKGFFTSDDGTKAPSYEEEDW